MGPRTRYGEIWNKWLNPKGIEEQRGLSAF